MKTTIRSIVLVSSLTALASFVPAPSFVEQSERFADPGSIAKKDLQLSAVLCSLGRLDLSEQGLRVALSRSIVVLNTHLDAP